MMTKLFWLGRLVLKQLFACPLLEHVCLIEGPKQRRQRYTSNANSIIALRVCNLAHLSKELHSTDRQSRHTDSNGGLSLAERRLTLTSPPDHFSSVSRQDLTSPKTFGCAEATRSQYPVYARSFDSGKPATD